MKNSAEVFSDSKFNNNNVPLCIASTKASSLCEKTSAEVLRGNTITLSKKEEIQFFKLGKKGQRRDYCFTFYPEDKTLNKNNIKEYLDNYKFLDDNQIRCIVCGFEICPKSKNVHFQCYIYFYNEKTISATRKYLFKIFNKHNHFEPCYGTLEQNLSYCSKDENYYIYGNLPSQGERCDFTNICNKILKGELTVDDIIINQPKFYHMYGRTLEKTETICLSKKFRTWQTTCDWRYGPTSSGKSETSYKNYNPDTHYNFNLYDNLYWGGYKGQEIVIINEFRGQIPYGELLDLIDKHPKEVKIKCKEKVPFLAKHIIITSPLHPSAVYNNLQKNDELVQLLRRINIIKHDKKISDEDYNKDLLQKSFKIFKKDWLLNKYKD